MATVTWIGAQGDVPAKKVRTITAGAGTTFTAAQNNKKATFGPTTTETATEIAAGIVAAVQGSTFGELQEVTLSNVAGVITAYGPKDGASWTFEITASGGAGSVANTTTVAPVSSHDAADGVNYSTGALPANGDTLIFENNSVDVLYGLTALTAITLSKLVRRTSYTGQIGLTRQSKNGYVEFRTRYLETSATTIQIDTSNEDSGFNNEAKFFLRGTLATAATLIVTGPQQGRLGSEIVDFYGAAGASVLDITGASVAMARFAGQTAAFTSVLAANAALTLGPGCDLTTLALTGVNAVIQADYNTLTLDGGGIVAVKDNANSADGGAATKIQNGTVLWQSTGTPAAITIESDGAFDASQAPAVFAVSSVNLVGDNWQFLDPAKRVARGTLVFTYTGTDLTKGVLNLGTGGTFTLTS